MNSVAKPATSTSNATSAPANAISPVTSAPLAANLASKTGAQTESPTVTVNSMPAGVDAVVGSRAANSTARESKRHTEPVASTFLSAARSGNTPSSSSSAPVAESGSVAAKEDYVAARLIYSVKPVSPSEALRNYVTGNVNVDALVDVTGHVKSVTVISGPEKLRNQAIAEMKQYIYEPARKSGKPVASRVQTSLKYWYEP